MQSSLAASGATQYMVAAYVAPETMLELMQAGVGALLLSKQRAAAGVAAGLIEELADFFPAHMMGRFVLTSRTDAVHIRYVSEKLNDLIIKSVRMNSNS